ncbi:hypothetical protein MMC2321_01825 [Chitinophaga sp. MM2321]
MKKKEEKKIINEQLHQTLIIMFAGLVILMLLVKTVFL